MILKGFFDRFKNVINGESANVTVSEAGDKVGLDVVVVGGTAGGGGDATAANQSLQITEAEETNTRLTQMELILTNIETNTAGGNVSVIDDLNDVDTTTVAPSTGDRLQWDGTNFVPVTPSPSTTDKLEGGNGSARVVTANADMDGTDNQNTSGYFQVQDTNGDGQLQLGGDTMTLGTGIERLSEGYGITLDVGRNWLFNSVTNLSQRLVKVTMQDSDATKTVELFTGQNIGFVTTIYFGEHINHQAAFTVTCPGTGIVGHPSGIVMDTPGQAIELRQTGLSEWTVVGSNFDLFSTGGGTPTTVSANRFTSFGDFEDGEDALTITGLTQDQPYLLHCIYEFNEGFAGDSTITKLSSMGIQGASIGTSPVQNLNGDSQLISSLSLIVIPDVNGEVRFTVFTDQAPNGPGDPYAVSTGLDVTIVELSNTTKGTGF